MTSDPRPTRPDNGRPALPQKVLNREYGDEHGGYLIDAESTHEADPGHHRAGGLTEGAQPVHGANATSGEAPDASLPHGDQ